MTSSTSQYFKKLRLKLYKSLIETILCPVNTVLSPAALCLGAHAQEAAGTVSNVSSRYGLFNGLVEGSAYG